jgi:hypothetical protein
LLEEHAPKKMAKVNRKKNTFNVFIACILNDLYVNPERVLNPFRV